MDISFVLKSTSLIQNSILNFNNGQINLEVCECVKSTPNFFGIPSALSQFFQQGSTLPQIYKTK
jgi:hypothetical protein